jgi:hypothetical protein
MSDTEQESTEISDFNFDEWSSRLGLSRKVTQIMRQEELTSKDVLALLELKDLKELGFPLGTIKLLMREIEQWNTSTIHGETSTVHMANEVTNDEHLTGAGKVLDDLLLNITAPSGHTSTTSSDAFIHMDPRTILTLKATSAKAVHITQFLTEKAKRRRQNRRKEFVIRSGNETSEALVLKTDDEHPYLGIFLEEWGAANMRLLNHLLASGQLKRSEIEFYLAYTTKIFEFAEIYDWNSVLNFDYLYREQQAEHKFKWGTFSPHMELQILVPKRARQTGSNGTPLQSSQKEECKIFKAKGSCPFGVSCRYQHKRQQPPKNQAQPDLSKNI